jgi:hypothetical protein
MQRCESGDYAFGRKLIGEGVNLDETRFENVKKKGVGLEEGKKVEEKKKKCKC